MIYPQKNKLITWFFHHYILRIVKSNFYAVKFNSLSADANRSVLLLANHFSWWDGFLMYYINQKVFKKRFHVMVIEETIQKVSFFKYLGAFSVSKNSRDILASLNYAATLLNDPDNLVLIFPQGKLYSNFADKINLEKGAGRIMQAAGDKCQTILAATFIETLQHKKPTASVNLKLLKANDAGRLQDIYQQHYNFSKLSQTQFVI